MSVADVIAPASSAEKIAASMGLLAPRSSALTINRTVWSV
jgi:hypothetical protein